MAHSRAAWPLKSRPWATFPGREINNIIGCHGPGSRSSITRRAHCPFAQRRLRVLVPHPATTQQAADSTMVSTSHTSHVTHPGEMNPDPTNLAPSDQAECKKINKIQYARYVECAPGAARVQNSDRRRHTDPDFSWPVQVRCTRPDQATLRCSLLVYDIDV